MSASSIGFATGRASLIHVDGSLPASMPLPLPTAPLSCAVPPTTTVGVEDQRFTLPCASSGRVSGSAAATALTGLSSADAAAGELLWQL
jgi:hypothetical protein